MHVKSELTWCALHRSILGRLARQLPPGGERQHAFPKAALLHTQKKDSMSIGKIGKRMAAGPGCFVDVLG